MFGIGIQKISENLAHHSNFTCKYYTGLWWNTTKKSFVYVLMILVLNTFPILMLIIS